MRHISTFLLLFTLTLPCQAQDQKPNTLTPKEVADGWILLFDGETTFGWTADSGTLIVSDGVLQLGGKNKALVRAPMAATLSAYELACETAAIYTGTSAAGGGAGFIDWKDNQVATSIGVAPGEKLVWAKTTLHGVGGDLNFLERSIRLHASAAGLRWHADADTKMLTRNVKIRPLEMKPLFNGKDLTGWKEFPGKKSKFAVIDNDINVKDGPGDLQTVGKYKDFILQLECKSNGKHLNSGIFFRCRDGEYQNGYEAQIHNGFTAEPAKKYLVEEYDPKTNQLTGKKEMTSTALDYGTGAIYRRIPARKAMSKDGEWFTMTIVAHGNHFATWVNGVQVVDWTDNRPKSDNARTGCRLEGGHISIQGHDPTTDLSFRNIQIAELK